jgi:hypothetical protein
MNIIFSKKRCVKKWKRIWNSLHQKINNYVLLIWRVSSCLCLLCNYRKYCWVLCDVGENAMFLLMALYCTLIQVLCTVLELVAVFFTPLLPKWRWLLWGFCKRYRLQRATSWKKVKIVSLILRKIAYDAALKLLVEYSIYVTSLVLWKLRQEGTI